MLRIVLPTLILVSSSLALFAKGYPKVCTKDCSNKGLDLTSSELREGVNDKINFENVLFVDSNLSGISFEKTNFNKTRFLNSNMALTKFKNVSIKSSVFEKVYSDSYVTMSASSIEHTVFRDLKIKKLDLSGTSIASCIFDGISSDINKSILLNDTKISASNFKDEQFVGRLDLSGASIVDTDFTNARFMSHVSTLDLKIERSRFINAYFAQAWSFSVFDSDFSGIRIEGNGGGYLICNSSNFAGAIIRNKKFWISSAENCNFSNADLSEIQSINFRSVKNSNFCNAKMPDGTVGKCLN